MSPAPELRHYTIKPVLRVFAQHLKKYRWIAIAIALGVAINEVILSIALPYLGKILFDQLVTFTPGQAAIGPLTHTVFLLFLVGMVSWVATRAYAFGSVFLVPRMMADLEQTSFEYLLGHSYQFFQDSFSGALVRRVSRISRAYEDIELTVQEKLIPIFVSLIGIIIVLFFRSVFIAGLVTAWIIISLLYNYYYSQKKMKQDVERARQDSHVTAVLADSLSNVLTIKLFTGEQPEAVSFKKESNKLRDVRYVFWKSSVLNYAIQNFVLLALQAVVLWIGIHYWSVGALTAGDVVLFQSYFTILGRRLLDSSIMMRTMYGAFADATEMVEILDQTYAVKDKPKAKDLLVSKGNVVFDHAYFSYGAASVLNDFNLSIKSGEKIALVGSSGAGKSTIVKLLFRFYDTSKGALLIDGQDISKVTQQSLRANISLVPQEPVLFHRSLIDNIRYGRPEATEKEVIKAAKLAHCHEFIEQLPDKYETHVGERGVKLSGGERQRVAIARAILKDAPILVLDEATSSLDSESESLIQDALHTLMRGKTTIVIAHRLSTIMSMDRIVIMDKGQVIDSGTHAELLNKESIYKKLWNLQVGGFFQEVS